MTILPTDQSAVQGRSVTIDCHAEGVPSPKYTWLVNGRPLDRDQRYLIMSSGDTSVDVCCRANGGNYC